MDHLSGAIGNQSLYHPYYDFPPANSHKFDGIYLIDSYEIGYTAVTNYDSCICNHDCRQRIIVIKNENNEKRQQRLHAMKKFLFTSKHYEKCYTYQRRHNQRVHYC